MLLTKNDRLQFSGLERLELRRLHADLCFMFKIVKNFVSCNVKNVLQFAIAVNARSGRFKLTTLRCKRLVFIFLLTVFYQHGTLFMTTVLIVIM